LPCSGAFPPTKSKPWIAYARDKFWGRALPPCAGAEASARGAGQDRPETETRTFAAEETVCAELAADAEEAALIEGQHRIGGSARAKKRRPLADHKGQVGAPTAHILGAIR